ncbi:MAG TPA: PilZ domain-containing protein [Terriglobales bacterium]
MGKRAEPRKPMQVPVRIFGTDHKGRIFSENVTTLDISRSGAKLAGVKAAIRVDEIIGLTYGRNKVHFRVKWTGKPGTPAEGQIGLLNLTPERPLWDFPLPVSIFDNFQREPLGERRRWVRIKCEVPLELHLEGTPNMYGKASDLSAGGCFIEMPIPLPTDSKFEIALWLGETKLRLRGEVVSSSPGFGVGVRFVGISAQDREFLVRHVDTLMRTVPG